MLQGKSQLQTAWEQAMAKFMITYLGGNPPVSEEESRAHMEAYKNWLQSLGDAAISPANPLRDTRTVSSNGDATEGSSIAMSGFTVVEAADIDAATAMEQSCPFLQIGGTLEVAELVEMQP